MQAASKLRKVIGSSWVAGALLGCFVGAAVQAQTAAPHASGTVKAITDSTITVTTAAGDTTVTVPATAKILDVPPGAKDLKSATPGQMSDIAVGDKVIVNGSAGDTGTALTAQRVILMKSEAIAQTHAAEGAAWAQGGGGIVKSVDTASGKLVVSSGLKTITVQTTPNTIIRHYSSGSVSFADAVKCSLSDVKVGDQLRMRGAKSDDGLTITADELVAGSFHNYSGLLASVDPATGTITLKDLATKKVVTVALSEGSDVHRIPLMLAQRIAATMKGTAANAAVASRGGAAGTGGGGSSGGGAAPEGGAGGGGFQRGGGAGRAGADLSQMISRLPTETIAGLKTGEAVMIVASSSPTDPNRSTAVTLVVGVEPILTAAPQGEGPMLSPWSVGGGMPEGGGGSQ